VVGLEERHDVWGYGGKAAGAKADRFDLGAHFSAGVKLEAPLKEGKL